MNYLVTGGKGRLGGTITALLRDAAHDVTSIDIDELDITDFAATRAFVHQLTPDVVIHCAAWTDVDGCAKDPERAMVTNGYGSGNLAAAAYDVDATIVYVSSNEVFDGTRSSAPYFEHDTPNPANPYGYSKYVGEQEIARLNPRHMIVRTSWLFAHGGKNFLQTMINAAAAGKDLRVVTDEVAHPTYTDDLAAGIVQIAGIGRPGTYHLVNAGAVSRWTFARYILDHAGYADTPIAKIDSSEWQRASSPPPHTTLANTAAHHLGVTLRPWQAAVDAFLVREGLYVDG